MSFQFSCLAKTLVTEFSFVRFFSRGGFFHAFSNVQCPKTLVTEFATMEQTVGYKMCQDIRIKAEDYRN